jgi:hypothetical protein
MLSCEYFMEFAVIRNGASVQRRLMAWCCVEEFVGEARRQQAAMVSSPWRFLVHEYCKGNDSCVVVHFPNVSWLLHKKHVNLGAVKTKDGTAGVPLLVNGTRCPTFLPPSLSLPLQIHGRQH